MSLFKSFMMNTEFEMDFKRKSYNVGFINVSLVLVPSEV